ncbi:hypothetical protein M569_16722, partial [Genlisea aurea]
MRIRMWRWALGLVYIFAVATIWIAASFVVQSVVDEGVSPFIVTYICNSLFVVYLPIVEIGRFVEDRHGGLLFWRRKRNSDAADFKESSDQVILLEDAADNSTDGVTAVGLDENGRWTRREVAKVSLLISPFWFLAQLTFNLSLKYTTVTSNTILSSTSSLFTFIVALLFLAETFTWLKLFSVLLCMAGTVIVSLGDSATGSSAAVASNPLLGDALAVLSSGFYAAYITLIRLKLPDEGDDENRASMAQFLGFLGLFNMLIFLPVALVLHFTGLEHIYDLSANQIGLIIGKGFLDNVLSDYLWAKAVLLTTTTVATAGLTIQVPFAAVVDTLTGNAPNRLDYVGAAVVVVGFVGINLP